MRHFALPAALAIALLPAPALAEHIHSDAPDVATGTFVIPSGVYQIEQNAQVDFDAGGPTFSLPSLHRFGLGRNVELRLETPVLGFSPVAGASRQFFALHGKWNLEGLQPDFLPPLALFAVAQLEPTNMIVPKVALLTDISLPFETGLNANLGANFPGTGPEATWAASVGHRLWSLEWAGYGEVEGDWSAGAGARVGVDGGIKRRFGDDDQLMLAVGTDALAPGTTYWVTTNWSHRFGSY